MTAAHKQDENMEMLDLDLGEHTRQGAAQTENWSISLRCVDPYCSGIDMPGMLQIRWTTL